MTRRRSSARALLVGAALILGMLTAHQAQAQQVSQVHRRLLMIGVHGTHYSLQGREGQDRASLNGWGGKLLINLAPFSGPGNNLLDNTVIGFFMQGGSGDGASVLHSGAEVDVHFVHNPIEGAIDPFVTLGVGRFRIRAVGAESQFGSGSEANLALSPGLGVRIPVRGLVELRADVRDVIVLIGELQGGTAHNFEATAGLNFRF